MKPEEKVKNKVEQLLKDRGAWFLNHAAGKNRIGIPDILACYKGRFLALELKRANGGHIKVQQKANLDQIAKQGGIAAVIHQSDIVEKILDIIDRPDQASEYIKKEPLLVNCGEDEPPTVYNELQFYGVWNDILLNLERSEASWH